MIGPAEASSPLIGRGAGGLQRGDGLDAAAGAAAAVGPARPQPALPQPPRHPRLQPRLPAPSLHRAQRDRPQVSCDWRRAGHVTSVLTSDWSQRWRVQQLGDDEGGGR